MTDAFERAFLQEFDTRAFALRQKLIDAGKYDTASPEYLFDAMREATRISLFDSRHKYKQRKRKQIVVAIDVAFVIAMLITLICVRY